MWVPAKERSITAHRISSVLAGQDVQPGDHVRHVTCRRRDCVNPDHLEPGSARINAWEVKYDASAPLALHPFNVVEMRYQRAYTSLRLKDMARMFGVSVGACSSVVLHRTWKDIPPVTAGWPEIEQALLMYSYIDADGVQDLKEHVENTYGLSL